MGAFFRASFDGALRPGQRRVAWLAAGVLVCAFVVAAVAGWLTVLRMNANELAAAVNTPEPQPAADVRVLNREVATGKPCEEQTWPYIEARCLATPAPQKEAAASGIRHGLANNSGGETAKSASTAPASAAPAIAPADTKKSGDNAKAVAPQAAPETTGSATPQTPPTTLADVPLPPTRPNLAARPNDVASLAAPAARASASSDPKLSEGESRAAQPARNALDEESRAVQPRSKPADRLSALQTRRAAQAERKAAAAERKASRRTARAEARSLNGDRVVRRWTEYIYETPSGRAHKVVVIRHGSLEDDFFRRLR